MVLRGRRRQVAVERVEEIQPRDLVGLEKKMPHEVV